MMLRAAENVRRSALPSTITTYYILPITRLTATSTMFKTYLTERIKKRFHGIRVYHSDVYDAGQL